MQMAAVLQRNGVYGRVVVGQRGVGYRAPCQSAVVRPCLRYPRVGSAAVGACQQLQALLRVYEEGGLNELIFCSGRIAQRRRLGPCAAVVGAALHVYALAGRVLQAGSCHDGAVVEIHGLVDHRTYEAFGQGHGTAPREAVVRRGYHAALVYRRTEIIYLYVASLELHQHRIEHRAAFAVGYGHRLLPRAALGLARQPYLYVLGALARTAEPCAEQSAVRQFHYRRCVTVARGRLHEHKLLEHYGLLARIGLAACPCRSRKQQGA